MLCNLLHRRPVASCVMDDICLLKERQKRNKVRIRGEEGRGRSVMIRKEEEEKGLGRIQFGLIWFLCWGWYIKAGRNNHNKNTVHHVCLLLYPLVTRDPNMLKKVTGELIGQDKKCLFQKGNTTISGRNSMRVLLDDYGTP